MGEGFVTGVREVIYKVFNYIGGQVEVSLFYKLMVVAVVFIIYIIYCNEVRKKVRDEAKTISTIKRRIENDPHHYTVDIDYVVLEILEKRLRWEPYKVVLATGVMIMCISKVIVK